MAKKWHLPTYEDPSQLVRRGDWSSTEVYPVHHRPRGNFNLCLDDLPEQYEWMPPLAERLCQEGRLSIYQRKDRRFINKEEFDCLVARDKSIETGDPIPEGQFTFWHGYLYSALDPEEHLLANRMRHLIWEGTVEEITDS